MIYQPAEDSELLAHHIPRYVKSKSFLDMGAGSGIQSRTAHKAGAKSVFAVDINPEVVSELKRNKISSIKSDLFSHVKGRFDVIAFNPPYLPEDKREDDESRVVTTGGKRGDEITLRFIRGLSKHLAQNGVALLIVSSLAPHARMKKELAQAHFQKKTIGTVSFFMEKLELWKITRKQ